MYFRTFFKKTPGGFTLRESCSGYSVGPINAVSADGHGDIAGLKDVSAGVGDDAFVQTNPQSIGLQPWFQDRCRVSPPSEPEK